MRYAVENASMCDTEGNSIEPINITIGLASFPDDAEDKPQLIEKADQALYQGKTSGKNCIFLYGTEGNLIKAEKTKS
jgi:GGDEF domain-containing protein